MSDRTHQFEHIDPARSREWIKSKRSVPAWAMSLLIHLSVAIFLFVAIRNISRGIGDEPARKGSIALAVRNEEQTDYIDGGSAQSSANQQDSQSEVTAQSVAASLPAVDLPPSDLGSLLPQGADQLSNQQATGLPSGGGLTEGGKTSKGGLGEDGTTSVFGAEGKGSRFVYVFDRSGSMAGYNGRPLAAAKQELLKSLRDLQDVHQFSIIFYNEHPQVFSPTSNQPQLVFADEQGTRQAEQFVRSIIASGGTEHQLALELALNMRPDVIFFLTDASQPQMFPNDLAKIRKMNHGATIHTIEFGFRKSDGRRNFLMTLAEQNGGQYVYVDVSRLQVR